MGFAGLGIDVGSTTVKLAGVDAAGALVWHHLEEAEPWAERQIAALLALAAEANGGAAAPLVATGYGRALVSQAGRQVTEITCHGLGVYRELGHGGTVVDIGGQDSKVIRVGPGGRVVDFAMNDKCAAGTGRFLENMARRLKVPIERIGDEALAAADEVYITSTCTVFAESEVISLLARGIPVAPILRGLHRSLLKRVAAMVRSVGLEAPLMLCGGVVQNAAVRRMLEEETGVAAVLPRHPQLTGAYGAALVAVKGLGTGA